MPKNKRKTHFCCNPLTCSNPVTPITKNRWICACYTQQKRNATCYFLYIVPTFQNHVRKFAVYQGYILIKSANLRSQCNTKMQHGCKKAAHFYGWLSTMFLCTDSATSSLRSCPLSAARAYTPIPRA